MKQRNSPIVEQIQKSLVIIKLICNVRTYIVSHQDVSTMLLPSLCKKGCYTVLYNACIHVLCTRYTRVIRMCITLRMDTLYTVAYNNYSITLCITSV